jgi:hypothetical protein
MTNTDAVELNEKKAPLLTGQAGDFGISPEDVAAFANLDNKYTEGDVVISSKMIVEDHGGLEALANKLRSNIKLGISGTSADLKERQAIYG